MKILRIEGENIASLKGNFQVDLAHGSLASAGVYAISGPTGSGKSTLLDTMCLALYGRTPRIGGRASSEIQIGEFSATEARSLLTRGQNHGFAQVTFESAQGCFMARWSVEKPKRTLKDGKSAKEASKTLFRRLTNNEWEAVDLRRREISEFVGLDYEQFTKTVLLAQGEFRKFLDSTGNDRSVLLEKLTNTSLYATLGALAFHKAKDAQVQLENLSTRQKDYPVLEDGVRSQMETDWQSCRQNLNRTRDQRVAAQKARDWFAYNDKLLLDLQQQEAQFSQAAQSLANHANLEADLADYDRSIPLREATDAWRTYKKSLEQEIQKHLEERTKHAQHKSQLDAATLEKDAFQGTQSEFETWQSATQQKLEQVSQAEKDLHKAIQTLQGLRGKRKQALQEFSGLKKLYRKQVASIAETEMSRLASMAWMDFPLEAVQSELQWNIARRDSVQLLIKHRTTLETTHAQTDASSPERTHWIEELRNNLVSGSPCPVCGGLEHPATLHDPASELELIEASILSSQERIAQYNDQKKQRDHLDSILPGKRELVASLRQQCHASIGRMADLRLQIHVARIQKFESSQFIASVLGAQTPEALRRDLEKRSTDRKAMEKTIQARYVDTSSKEAASRTLLQNLQSSCAEKEQQTQTAIAKANSLRESLGLEVERAQMLLRLTPDWASDTRSTLDTLRTSLARLRGSLENQKKQIEDHQNQKPAEPLSHYLHVLEQLVPQINDLDEKNARLHHALENDSENRKKLGNLLQEITLASTEVSRWRRMNDLIGGKNGDLFRRFAQGITLHRLVSLANRHLARLHNRYRLKAWDNLELVIEDLDMGLETRSTRSLSGGEGFLVSMALALGLSDMASRQVRIGSLFIDEGFGTLDSNTLQTVIAVLGELREQGRMVGIISHVDGLARQLGASIQITPNGDGTSRLTTSP